MFNSELLLASTDYVSSVCGRWVACLQLIDRANSVAPAAGHCYLDLRDAASSTSLTFCNDRADAFLISDALFLRTRAYTEPGPALEPDRHPWPKRLSVAIWRGSSTVVRQTSLMETPRVRLCRVAAKAEAGELIDAGISSIVQAPTYADAQRLEASGLVKPPLSMDEHCFHKYQIDIDGNSNSWPGLFKELLSASPVLKVLSPTKHRQW